MTIVATLVLYRRSDNWIHNRFCKYLLGVHKKSSNFASRCELGRLPILSFIASLTYKYYSRLEKLPSTRLVKEVFDVDRGLYLEGKKSWSSFIYKSTENMKIDISKLSTDDISKIVNNYYKKISWRSTKNLKKSNNWF